VTLKLGRYCPAVSSSTNIVLKTTMRSERFLEVKGRADTAILGRAQCDLTSKSTKCSARIFKSLLLSWSVQALRALRSRVRTVCVGEE
jgi:hypothetical protein